MKKLFLLLLLTVTMSAATLFIPPASSQAVSTTLAWDVFAWTTQNPPALVGTFLLERSDLAQATWATVSSTIAGTATTFVDTNGGVGKCWRIKAIHAASDPVYTTDSDPSNVVCLGKLPMPLHLRIQ